MDNYLKEKEIYSNGHYKINGSYETSPAFLKKLAKFVSKNKISRLSCRAVDIEKLGAYGIFNEQCLRNLDCLEITIGENSFDFTHFHIILPILETKLTKFSIIVLPFTQYVTGQDIMGDITNKSKLRSFNICKKYFFDIIVPKVSCLELPDLRFEYENDFSHQYPNLKFLDITIFEEVFKEYVIMLRSLFKISNLESLCLRNFNYDSSKTIFDLIHSSLDDLYKPLKCLKIETWNVSDKDLRYLEKFPSLLRIDFLSFDLTGKTYSVIPFAMLKDLTLLQKLSFSVPIDMSDSQIDSLICLKNLKSLCLRGHFIVVLEKMLRNIHGLTSLKLLIEEYDDVDKMSLECIKNCASSLKKLKLENRTALAFAKNYKGDIPYTLTHLVLKYVPYNRPPEILFDYGRNYCLRSLYFLPKRCREYVEKDHFYLMRNRKQHQHVKNVCYLLLCGYLKNKKFQQIFVKDIVVLISKTLWSKKYEPGWNVFKS